MSHMDMQHSEVWSKILLKTIPCSKDRAVHLGIKRDTASFLLSVIGISTIIGKIVIGYLSDRPWINRLCLYNVCVIICGLSEYDSSTKHH